MASKNEEDIDQELSELSNRINQLTLLAPPDMTIRSRKDCVALRKLNECRNEREMISERRRVAEVVRNFREEVGKDDDSRSTECQACSKSLVVPTLDGLFCKAFMENEAETFDFETDNIAHRVGLSLTLCCGKCVCMECFSQYSTKTCPACKVGTMPMKEEVTLRRTIHFAEEGDNPWAQFEAGARLMRKSETSTSKKEKQKYLQQGMEWLKTAACRGVAGAAGMMVMRYKEHIKGEERRWLTLAAELGEPEAQMLLGAMFDEDGGKEDEVEAVKWYTLSMHQNSKTSYLSAFNLAGHFSDGTGGLDKSLLRARHYYQLAAEGGADDASFYLSRTLYKMGEDTMLVPGCCTIPRCLYWAKESLKRGDSSDASKLVPAMEIMFRGGCIVCGEEDKDLSRCSKCKLFYYCGTSCQTEHWKDGHKYDCVAIDS